VVAVAVLVGDEELSLSEDVAGAVEAGDVGCAEVVGTADSLSVADEDIEWELLMEGAVSV